LHIALGSTSLIRAVISEGTKWHITESIPIEVSPLQGFCWESVRCSLRVSFPRRSWIRPTVSISVSATKTVKHGSATHFWACIALVPLIAISITIAIRISPLSRFVDERIAKVRPTITVGVSTAPAITARGRTD
jgi:hypothetical protein